MGNETIKLRVKSCGKVPEEGGRGWYVGGGLVEVEGKVVWGGLNGVYMWDEGKWNRVGDGGEWGGTLAVCGGRIVCAGGLKDVCTKVMELREGRWSLMSDMLVGCTRSTVLSGGGGGMVVIGGLNNKMKSLKDVQVFDEETKTWHRGPLLPQPCSIMSAVVHGDQVFVMGGNGMARAVWCADIRDLTTRDTQQFVWRKLPDVPYDSSSVSVVDGVLLAIGGAKGLGGSQKTSIYGFHSDDQKWKHVGNMPVACSWLDTLVLPGEGVLVVYGLTRQVWKITVEGLAKLFSVTPSSNEAVNKSGIEADERFSIRGSQCGDLRETELNAVLEGVKVDEAEEEEQEIEEREDEGVDVEKEADKAEWTL